MIDLDTGYSIRRTILSKPHDIAPRLVYADWIEENGEEAYAKFIRLSTEIGQSEHVWPSCDHLLFPPDLQGKVLDLMEIVRSHEVDRHLEIGCGDAHVVCLYDWSIVPKTITDRSVVGVIRSGFIDEVRLPMDLFVKHGPQIAAKHPITKWALSDREAAPRNNGRKFAWYLGFRLLEIPYERMTLEHRRDWIFEEIYGCHSWQTDMFSSRDEANQFLSDVCYKYARKHAGID